MNERQRAVLEHNLKHVEENKDRVIDVQLRREPVQEITFDGEVEVKHGQKYAITFEMIEEDEYEE